MPTWPATLPAAPATSGWQETPEDNVARFQPDVGPPKLRRRYTGSGSKVSARFLMTTDQCADLDDFFRGDLADGSLPFTWAHPVTGASLTWVFEGPPSYEASDYGLFNVSVQLRRLP
jgi:hypothetical protein